MQVIPVLDLSDGIAVHARGGHRAEYLPVRSRLLPGHAGDAIALARAYREQLDAPAMYIADLDALERNAPQRPLIRKIMTEFDRPALVDAGLYQPTNSVELVVSGVGTVVIGLESLPSLEALTPVMLALGASRVALSLDMRNGRPLIAPAIEATHGGELTQIAKVAVRLGVTRMIVLDVGRVGRDGGVDLVLVQRLRSALPGVELYAGGGIRTVEDLEALADAGVHGALVGTAIHDGRIGAPEVRALALRQSKANSVR